MFMSTCASKLYWFGNVAKTCIVLEAQESSSGAIPVTLLPSAAVTAAIGPIQCVIAKARI